MKRIEGGERTDRTCARVELRRSDLDRLFDEARKLALILEAIGSAVRVDQIGAGQFLFRHDNHHRGSVQVSQVLEDLSRGVHVLHRHPADNVTFGACLMTAPPLRAAGGAIAVPGTADVVPGTADIDASWRLMTAPYSYGPRKAPKPTSLQRPFPKVIHQDTGAPLSRWMVGPAFPTREECEAQRAADPNALCVADDERRKQ